MSKIDDVREDYNIGDPIRISCTLGVKEGFILAFSDTRIKLKPFDPTKKPISISEETITDWEEAAVPADAAAPQPAPSAPQPVVASAPQPAPAAAPQPVETPAPQPAPAAPQPVETPAPQPAPAAAPQPVEAPAPQPAQPQAAPQPSYIKGYIDLDKVDPKKGKRVYVHSIKDLVLGPQPASTVEQKLPRLVKPYKDESENQVMVYATGYISADKKDYGFIWDQELQAEVYFGESDIIDDDLYELDSWLGVRVTYLKIKSAKGTRAVGIVLPHPVYELLALAESTIDDGYEQEASDMLQIILNQYPNNADAKELITQTKDKAKRRVLQSASTPLDLDNLSTSSKAKAQAKAADAEPSAGRSEKGSKVYKQARELMDKRMHREALDQLLKAFAVEPSNTLIKDICTQYCTLCSKKFLDEHPEELANVEDYRRKGQIFTDTYAGKLPKELTTYHFLESTYFVFHQYDKFLEVIDKVISVKAPLQRIIYMNKKAVALMALKRTADAEAVLGDVLKIDPENQKANMLLQQIRSNNYEYDLTETIAQSEAESSERPLSSFLLDVINNYTDFYGVHNFKILDETKLYSKDTYNAIKNQTENAKSDSQTRSQLLLTKQKIFFRLNNRYDQRDFALYCNDMARLTILRKDKSEVWDVVRFYFNESFSLSVSWDSTIRQFIQYLETLIPSKRSNIFDKLGSEEDKERRVDEDIYAYVTANNNKISETDWLDGLMQPALYNQDVSIRISTVLFNNPELKSAFINKLNQLGKPFTSIDTYDEFLKIWEDLRDARFAAENTLKNSYLAKVSHTTLQALNNSMQSLAEPSKQSWLFQKDRERIREVLRVLVVKIDKYLRSEEYTTREDNYQDAARLLTNLITDVRQNPTKFSYETILPVLMRYNELLEKSWETYETGSRPIVDVNLLTQEIYLNGEDTLSLQMAVSNDKSSAPISNISLSLADVEEVESFECKEGVYVDYLKGGGQPVIFHMNIKLKDQYKDIKAFSIRVLCSFITKQNETDSVDKELSIRLYSENEFIPFTNPYNAGPPVMKREMFFGRDAFINNLVDVMYSSPSKQLVFYGQKRSGKSSVLFWLKNELESRGAFCADFSLGMIANNLNAASLFYQILVSIKSRLRRYRDAKPDFEIPTASEFEQLNPANPVQTFIHYMSAFKDACKATPGWEDKLIVIMIDEFTYIYSGIQDGRVDKTIMQQWKSVVENPDSSFASVLVGQDVIPYFKEEEYARNAFQMMESYRLDYLEEPDARDLIEKPIGRERYAQGAVDLILQYSACSPYYIQKICGELVSEMNKRKSIIATIADVNDVVENKIISNFTERDFDNLISPGDAININGITEHNIMAVLYRIAQLTANSEFCSLTDIVTFSTENIDLDEKKAIEAVLKNLCLREVVETKEGLYRIKVKLFKQWILIKSRALPSLEIPAE